MAREYDRATWIRLAVTSVNSNANVKPKRAIDIIPEQYRREMEPMEEGSAKEMMAMLRGIRDGRGAD